MTIITKEQANKLTKWGIMVLVILCAIYLLILSILFQDLKYPREHPYLFTLETLLFGFGCGSIIFLMAHGRGDLNLMTVVEFLVVSIKFGLFHILLQFSGFYSYVFSYN
jgi:hypothetical protein